MIARAVTRQQETSTTMTQERDTSRPFALDLYIEKGSHNCTRRVNIARSWVTLLVPSLLSSPRYAAAHCVHGVESVTPVQYHKPYTKWGKEEQKEGTSPRRSKITGITKSLSHSLCHSSHQPLIVSDTLRMNHTACVRLGDSGAARDK